MSVTRRGAISLITVALLCTGATRATGGAPSSAVDHHQLAHVHDFPELLMRLSPPTGTPRLTWQDAYRLFLRDSPFADSGSTRMPRVELATLWPNPTEFPPDPVLAWVVVVPDAKVVELGVPDFTFSVKPSARRTWRCPAYTVFDATTGRGFGAFQTCEPAFRS